MKLDAYLEQRKRNAGLTKAEFARMAGLHTSIVTRICQGALANGPTWARIMDATHGAVTPLDHWPQAKKRRSK